VNFGLGKEIVQLLSKAATFLRAQNRKLDCMKFIVIGGQQAVFEQ
jgi:hypothetical protein